MKKVGLIFPHQLFERHEILEICDQLYLIEESLFFTHFNFHKQKIAFHRASMRAYEKQLLEKGKIKEARELLKKSFEGEEKHLAYKAYRLYKLSLLEFDYKDDEKRE